MEVIASENYLAESPQSVGESMQSLYADEQPKRRLKSRETHSKLAETVGIENTIMLNAEDLAKASGRISNKSRDETLHEKNLSLSRQTRGYLYGTNRRRENTGTRRHYYESRGSPASDINLGKVTTETRSSVIHGMASNRKRKTTNSESESEEGNVGEKDDVEKSEYGHLRCYEQFDKDNGSVAGNLSVRSNYVQSTSDSRLEGSRICGSQPDNSNTPDRISEKFTRGPVSGARCYPVSVVDSRTYPQGGNTVYLQQHVHDLNNQYRMQHPPDFPMSQGEQRGKQFFERTGLVAASSSGPGMVPHGYPVNPHGKFNIPDGIFVQTHPDIVNTYAPGYTVYETRSPASSTSSGKDRESLPDQESLKGHVQHNNMKDEHGQASPRQGKILDETTDGKVVDANKTKAKRNTSGKAENANKCAQCCKTFASSSALAKHKLTHSDERRYVCTICGKGFKRQDHLNGHTLTHRDKKPYECKFTDCEKSYCDMRSLRRHYENYHPSPDGVPTVPSAAPGILKPTTGTDHKLQKAGNNNNNNKNNNSSNNSSNNINRQHVEESCTADMDEKQFVPELPYHGKSKQEMPQPGMGRKRNSDSVCSNNSDDFNRRLESHSPHQSHITHDKATSAMNMLKQVVEHSQDMKGEMKGVEGYPHGYYTIPEGFNPQWYPYPHVIPVYQLNNNQRPIMVPQSLKQYSRNNAFCTGDPPQLVPNYPVSQGQINKNNEQTNDENNRKNTRKGEEDRLLGRMYRDGSATPTDPTSIAIVNATDLQSRFTDVNSGFSPVVQWKSVPVKENSGMPPLSIGNTPVSMQHNPVNLGAVLPEHQVNHEQPPTQLNITIPSYPGDKRGHEMTDIEYKHPAKRHCPSLPLNSGDERLLKLSDPNAKPSSLSEGSQLDDVFRNPPVTPPRKPRPKPEPIHIPASNFSCSPLSPPIYTPPPMLSPRSIFHVSNTMHTPRCNVTTPLTPSRFFLAGSRSRKNSLDNDAEQPELIIPEPKINIGVQFQAEIPQGMAPRKQAEFDKHRVSVCWIPFEHETKKRALEIEAFLDMACSVAVHGGGSNKEYALHVLFRLKGNIKQAVRHILANKSAIQKGDGLADYHYQGSVKWTSKERLKFREALTEKGKDFFLISKELETKTVAQCVEFYYLWKATHPEAMRSRTRYAETESEPENIEYFSDDANSTLVFECDFPGCNSKFISRQALNGHIRVHGGSFMKPSEPKRTKIKTTTTSDGTTVPTNVGRPATKPAKPSTGAPVIPNGDGTLPEFACKVCGRIFHKIKSRSAHMKTHVKRNDDDHHHGGSKV